MIWVIFFLLIGASIACTLRFVPAEYRCNYARHREDWLAAGLFNAIWIAAAVQFGTMPSAHPLFILPVIGIILMAVGYALVIWARRMNPFFVPEIVVPGYIVTAGPYYWIDHPGYMGLALVASGSFILLGQWWAFFPTFAYLCLLARRIHVEERLLSTHFQR
jgi:protein-S-isoprenylcysteine O-methyltransferase Ste14